MSGLAHKANPYEKGTESYSWLKKYVWSQAAHKANPYEKGTESVFIGFGISPFFVSSQS